MIVDRIPKNFVGKSAGKVLLYCWIRSMTWWLLTSMQVVWCQHYQEVVDRDLSGALLGMQDFLNKHLRLHRLSLSKSKNGFQTQVISNDQPDSYVIGENPAITNEKISSLLVLRDNQACPLILACLIGIEIPSKFQRFLSYKKAFRLQGKCCIL